MKKITCIQQYVIDNLIEDKILTSNSLLDAVSKVCSKEQFDNILSILIETSIPCTNEEDLEDKIDTPVLFYKRKQMKLLKNQNLTM